MPRPFLAAAPVHRTEGWPFWSPGHCGLLCEIRAGTRSMGQSSSSHPRKEGPTIPESWPLTLRLPRTAPLCPAVSRVPTAHSSQPQDRPQTGTWAPSRASLGLLTCHMCHGAQRFCIPVTLEGPCGTSGPAQTQFWALGGAFCRPQATWQRAMGCPQQGWTVPVPSLSIISPVTIILELCNCLANMLPPV